MYYLFLKTLEFRGCFDIRCQTYHIGRYSVDAEAITQRCPVKNVFLKILQNSQENTSA